MHPSTEVEGWILAIRAAYDRGLDAGLEKRLTETMHYGSDLKRWAEALQWCCSASLDFAPGGKSREGWIKWCAPLLDEYHAKTASKAPRSP